jgi:hypothetical protein
MQWLVLSYRCVGDTAPIERITAMIELYHNDMSVCAQKVRFALTEKKLKWVSGNCGKDCPGNGSSVTGNH